MRRRFENGSVSTRQVTQVQGPQLFTRPPKRAYVEVQSELKDDYLGSALISLDASLRVLDNRQADELLCKHGYQLYRKMLSDDEIDADITTLLNGACAQPISFTSSLNPTDPGYKKSMRYASIFNQIAEHFDIDAWIREQLRYMLTFGNSASESHWEFIDTAAFGELFVITEFRLQQPEMYGIIVDRWGHIYGVAPLNQAAGISFPLGNLIPLESDHIKNLTGAVPLYKLALWIWERAGIDPRGTSILKPAYLPWWLKQKALEEWTAWVGRYGQPSIIAMPGPDATNKCDENGRPVTPTQALLNIIKNFKSASALALPFGSEFHIAEAKGDAEPFIRSVDAFNRAISRAILGQHLATGEGENQSRAAAEVHGLVLRQTINTLRFFKAKMIKRDFIRPVMEMNFGRVDEELIPVVDMGDGDVTPLTATDIAVLLQSGYFTMDQLMKLDRQLGLPIRETDKPAGPQAISNMAKEEKEANDAPADKFTIRERPARTNTE